ncbi:hypothetical protein [Bacillus sp. FSL K6-0067]|uniref:hypothetical protein n=1 Tax=Bacillus sp. FSL K6-0067 TaxID=2921412 RepID=UPI00077A8C4D|nr:hypothetical protein [Bacillus cereus]KXY25721.1 hypothetical protein AT267_27220 [Bacillus cereus]
MEQTKYTFDTNGDYKVQFETYINTLITARRESDSGAISNSDVRAKEINSLIDAYVETVGGRPDEFQLERLTDLLLYEELNDPTPWKSRKLEYPFFSERQLLRRRECESSDELYESYSVDKRNQQKPVRRMRSKSEHKFIDKTACIRNKERRRKYREFTKVQQITVYIESEII